MAPLGKRGAEGQNHSAPKRQRFIEEFLSGGFKNVADSSSSEDEVENLESQTVADPKKRALLPDEIVDTPKTDLTPESPDTPERKLTLPLRNTPGRPLAVQSPGASRRDSTQTAHGPENEASSPQSRRKTRGSVTTTKAATPRNQAPPSRSLFDMWGQSPPTLPQQESQQTARREASQRPRHVPQRRGRGGRLASNRDLSNDLSADIGPEPSEIEEEEEATARPLAKGKIPSQLPPEILRGLYTSPPGTKSKPGLNRNLPPLSRIEDIFDDIAKTAVNHGFEKVLDHLKSRELRVATMFSGTESPLLALDMLRNSFQRLLGRTFQLNHLFSAEIEPFKQSYIQRNFSPELLFRDVNELVMEKATTAFGSERHVPQDIDMLVIGFPCVDFSNLNTHKRDIIKHMGESGHTFFGVMRYCQTARPPIIVVENVCSAPWGKLATLWDYIGYTSYHTKVDTKNYYLPQTRERGYMICIRRDHFSLNYDSDLDADSDLKRPDLNPSKASDFSRLMKSFERPASSPITDFMLKETDPRFRIAVDDISSIPIKERQAVDWTRYKARHLAYRIKEKLGDKRPLTKWTDNGACYPPDFYWRKWMQVQTERVWDTLDSNYLRAFIRGYDMNFKSRFIDLSQGIDRELDTRAYGVAGCLTPRGQAFITSRGGPVLGIESLALQGIPVDKLLLSSESQRDLQDLAGNAMSSTVVGSAICSVLILYFHLLKEGDASYIVPAKTEQAKKQLTCMNDQPMITLPPEIQKGQTLSTHELHKAAKRSTKICACEGHSTSSKWNLLRCAKCGHTACNECGSNPTHFFGSIAQDQVTERWMDFENHLKTNLPMRFTMKGLDRTMWENLRDMNLQPSVKKAWDKFLSLLDSLLDDELRFHSITRQTAWTVHYEGTHSRLELVFSRERVQWLLYANAPSDEPSNSPLRQMLELPIASMLPVENNLLEGLWHVISPVSSSFEINIEGKGDAVPSFYAEIGLQHPKYAGTKVYSQLSISASDDEVQGLEFDIRGDYELLQNCGAASGSLHKKLTSHREELPIYFFLDPTEIGEADFDSWVFALDHERLDTRQTRLTIAESQPGFSGVTARNSQQTVQCWYRKKEAHACVSLEIPAALPTYRRPTPGVSVRGATCEESYVPFWTCTVQATRAEEDFKKNEWEVTDLSESPQMVQRFSWLLQRAASMTDFESWQPYRLPSTEKQQTCCSLCSPTRPRILWTLGDKDQIQPYENPEDAAVYEQNIKQRPAPFLGFAMVDNDGGLHLRVCLNVMTLLHRAWGKLCQGDGISFQWRLCIDHVGFLHPRLGQLKERSNDGDEESVQPPNFTRHFLRREQLRSLTWMIAQEDDSALPFEEEEVAEALIPSLSWRAEARATTKKAIKGGILGDEVGYGKTAISLALFDSQFQKDSNSTPERVKGAIPITATLIVVPNHLVDQWRNEIRKFLGNTYNVLEIKTVNALNTLTIRDFQKAHIVLVSATLFRGDKYYNKVSLFAAPPGEPRGDGRIFSDWLKDAMDGIRSHVDCLITNGSEAVLQKIHGRTDELAASDIYRKYQPSKRLKGAKLQEYLAKVREEKRRKGEDVDHWTAIKRIAKEQRARQKQNVNTTGGRVGKANADRITQQALSPKQEIETKRTSGPSTFKKLNKRQPEFGAVVVDNSDWSKDRTMAYIAHAEEDLSNEEEGSESDTVVASTRRSRRPRNQRMMDDSDEWQGSDASTYNDDDNDSEDAFSDSWSDSSEIPAKRPKAPPKKRKREAASDSDTPAKAKPKAKRVTKAQQVKGVPTGEQVRQEARQAFALHLARNDWRHLKSPLLHMFEFNRIIIDEFTYSKDRNFTATLAIPARKKWILSGTPPLNDFADVKSFSPFLDVTLGEDDEDSNIKPENERLRVMQRERTEAEQFRPFTTRHSAAWHKRRHEVAQNFLDRFMRKNIPLFDEIPWTEHICEVTMSPAERGSYLETYMQMMSANLQLKRTGDKEEASREIRQLDLIMKESTYPEEVLLKLCSLSLYSQGDSPTQGRQSSTSAIEAREGEVNMLKNDLVSKLKQTWWLRSRITHKEEEPNHFDNLVRTLRKQGWGDSEISESLRILIEETEKDHRPSDGQLFYSTPDEKATNRHDHRPLIPARPARVMSDLKACTDDLRRIIIKIVSRMRSIRFLKAVQAFHHAHANGDSGESLSCNICHQKQSSLFELFILGECGHITCGKCLEKSQEAEECQGHLCTGSVQGFRVLKAADLGIVRGFPASSNAAQKACSTDHGSKLSSLVQLIKNGDTIPSEDQVILFIQYPEVMKAASDALKEAGISHLVVSSNDHHASRKIIQFQSHKENIRVLILQLGDVTAAGLNLQVANHIIFLGPLFTMSRYDYTSGMTQAIGRARRYGQMKHVHIYHLLTLNTIEVNIFEERRQECIVRREGRFLTVDEGKAREDEACWKGKDLQASQLDNVDD